MCYRSSGTKHVRKTIAGMLITDKAKRHREESLLCLPCYCPVNVCAVQWACFDLTPVKAVYVNGKRNGSRLMQTLSLICSLAQKAPWNHLWKALLSSCEFCEILIKRDRFTGVVKTFGRHWGKCHFLFPPSFSPFLTQYFCGSERTEENSSQHELR